MQGGQGELENSALKTRITRKPTHQLGEPTCGPSYFFLKKCIFNYFWLVLVGQLLGLIYEPNKRCFFNIFTSYYYFLFCFLLSSQTHQLTRANSTRPALGGLKVRRVDLHCHHALTGFNEILACSYDYISRDDNESWTGTRKSIHHG